MHGIGLRPRKAAIILRVGEHRQLRVVRDHVRHIPRRKRFGDGFHHSRRSLMTAKILQLFPDCQLVQACEVRGRTHGTKSLYAMAVFAMPRQKHSSKGISSRGRRQCLLRPRHIGGCPFRRAVTRHQHKGTRCNREHSGPEEIPPRERTVIGRHNSPVLPRAKQGTALAGPLSTRIAWRSAPLRKTRGKRFYILPAGKTRAAWR